ncbi:MAG: hypothetical protein GXY33_21295 [Phycisphaerae bacterium]|nr:hypothetical protein [Phycisphaerae bacterium]
MAIPAMIGADPVTSRQATQTQPADPQPAVWAMLVGGVNKDVEEKQAKDRAVLRLRKTLVEEAVEPSRLHVLVNKDSLVRDGTGLSTAEQIRKTFAELKTAVRSRDVFVFYYVGQANVLPDGTLRLNLSGPDLLGDELVKLIGELPAERMVIVVDCPAAGTLVKGLTAKGRVVICGARLDQHYSTRFSDCFVPALSDAKSDVNGDGRITLLEAFREAAMRLDKIYEDREMLKTETPILEDDADGVPSQQPWLYQEAKKDGALADSLTLRELLIEKGGGQ